MHTINCIAFVSTATTASTVPVKQFLTMALFQPLDSPPSGISVIGFLPSSLIYYSKLDNVCVS